MGKITGFMEYARGQYPERPIQERILDYKEINLPFPKEELNHQAARCMDCGVPFCNQGCPLGNLIPTWNDLVYKDRWKEAIDRLHLTNNFPEFTGLLCPAPCEGACVLGINEKPVTIKYVEYNIIEHAIKEGWVIPKPPQKTTGKRVAVIGSGPAGLACAQQLRRVGHDVVVFERSDRIGGLLRYGIPDFKMTKDRIDFRLWQMQEEGVEFKTNVNVGKDISVEELNNDFDAIALCIGATQARELQVPGRELEGVYLAMDYLSLQNKTVAGDFEKPSIHAKDKHVIILGGGDTGADCLGTAIRQGAKSVKQFEIMNRPPDERAKSNPWPTWPFIFRTSSAHDEAKALAPNKQDVRDYAIMTKSLSGENGKLKTLHACRLEWVQAKDGKGLEPKEIPGSEFEMAADLIFLAMGFTGPEKNGILSQLGVNLDARGNVSVNENYQASVPKVFAAGDAKRGASLIVWAIAEGRKCARSIDLSLMGETELR